MRMPSAHLRLLLVRHAATAANIAGRYQGRTDEPLHSDGVAQTENLRSWLQTEPVDVCIHSGTQRTQATATLILPQAVPLVVDARWREIDHGLWEGCTYQELLDTVPEQAHAHWNDPWHVPAPEGETLAALHTRVQAAVQDLIATYAGKTVLLVAHATSLQLLLCELLDTAPTHYWRWKFDLASLTCLDLYPPGPILNWHNRGYQPPPAC